MVNDIGNLAFLSKVSNIKKGKQPPNEYFPDKIDLIGEEILTAQCIPNDPSLWTLDNYEKFLEMRRENIVNEINDLMESLG